MKALLHYRATPGFVAAVASHAPEWLDVAIVPEDDADALARLLPETEVLLHVLEPVTAQLIAAAPRLALIQKIGVGVNTIDLDACRAAGVGVANMPGTNTQAVAEHALALSLAVLRRVITVDAETRAGRGWSLPHDLVDSQGELCGRRVGLVGYGAVGRRFAEILDVIGADVRCTTGSPRSVDGPARWCAFDELIASSDLVSLHLPLTPDTARMIDAEVLAAIPAGAVLVNTARGGLVDEA
ncbi:MAG: hypothetical protein KDB35_21670, partial [Acidimicrobiales bacterium]|nr:hypothetical protein [Acidimicrobiales bacterium]